MDSRVCEIKCPSCKRGQVFFTVTTVEQADVWLHQDQGNTWIEPESDWESTHTVDQKYTCTRCDREWHNDEDLIDEWGDRFGKDV